MVCGENEYCKSENGAPRCVRKSTGFGKLLQFYILLAFNIRHIASMKMERR